MARNQALHGTHLAPLLRDPRRESELRDAWTLGHRAAQAGRLFVIGAALVVGFAAGALMF